MHGLMGQLVRSAAAWPVTILWITGAVIIFVVAEGWAGWPAGVVIFMLVAIGVLAASSLREVDRELDTIHTIVNGHRNSLIRRNEILERALSEAGVEIPDEGRQETKLP